MPSPQSLKIILLYLLTIGISLGINCITLGVSRGLLERRVLHQSLKVLVLESLRDARNYHPLGRMMESYGLGISNTLESSCNLWTMTIYQNVRQFVLQNRRFERFFLGHWCMRNIPFIEESHWRDNLSVGMFSGIPPFFDVEPLLAPELIDEPNRDRSHYANIFFWQNIDWDALLRQETIGKVSIHCYLPVHLVPSHISEDKFRCTLVAASDSCIDREEVQIGLLIMLLERRYKDEEGLSAQDRQAYDITNQIISTRISENSSARVLLNWWSDKGDTIMPDIFSNVQDYETIKIAALMQGIRGCTPPESLLLAARRILPTVNDHDFLEFIHIIAHYNTDHTMCRTYLNNRTSRIMDIGYESIKNQSELFKCLDGKGSISYFRRWRRFLSRRRTSLRNIASSDHLLVMPNRRKVVELHLRKELKGLLWKTNGVINIEHTDGFVFLSINKTIEYWIYKMEIKRLVIVVLMLKLHYSNSVYDLSSSWATNIVCRGEPDELLANLYNDYAIVEATTIAYNICC